MLEYSLWKDQTALPALCNSNLLPQQQGNKGPSDIKGGGENVKL